MHCIYNNNIIIPNLKIAIKHSTIPAKKHNNIAKCGPDSPPKFVCLLVINANNAVGPIVNCRHVPNNAYTNPPIIAEYRPNFSKKKQKKKYIQLINFINL